MKNLLKVVVVTVIFVLCFSANSFAETEQKLEQNIGLSVFLGYGFKGTYKFEGSDYYNDEFYKGELDISGMQFGLRGHYFLSFNPSFIIGLGGFYQQSKIKFDGGGDGTRKAAGVDIALLFAAPSMPEIHPYLRATYSFYDKVEKLSGSGFGIGAGVQYDVTPQVRLFAEIMYDSAAYKQKEAGYDYYYDEYYAFETKDDISMISINVGATYLLSL